MYDLHIHPEIKRAHTLPAAHYGDPDLYRRQLESVFARSWHVAADVESLPEPGHVLPITLLEGSLDEPLLLTRDEGSPRSTCAGSTAETRLVQANSTLQVVVQHGIPVENEAPPEGLIVQQEGKP